MAPLKQELVRLSDELLMQQVALTGGPAFDELYTRYARRMFSYFYRMLWQDVELANDCTQELFLKVVRYKDNYDAGRSFSTWVYTIACNICKNEYRRHEMKSKLHIRGSEATEPVAAKQLDMKQFAGAMKEELAALDEEKRTLFTLRFEEQLSVPQISAILNIPEGTVKSRIFYLLKYMGGRLKTFQFIHHEG
jgi:RNA polymerase sigma-70 factor, ECF subfamily